MKGIKKCKEEWKIVCKNKRLHINMEENVSLLITTIEILQFIF